MGGIKGDKINTLNNNNNLWRGICKGNEKQ
jgi:hypothetical protein